MGKKILFIVPLFCTNLSRAIRNIFKCSDILATFSLKDSYVSEKKTVPRLMAPLAKVAHIGRHIEGEFMSLYKSIFTWKRKHSSSWEFRRIEPRTDGHMSKTLAKPVIFVLFFGGKKSTFCRRAEILLSDLLNYLSFKYFCFFSTSMPVDLLKNTLDISCGGNLYY